MPTPDPARSGLPPRWLAPLILLAALALTLWAYLPGLHGPFLFDDFANLPVIGATGPVDTWATFWRYITSGTADPTGRPLTLLTFLLDARNWPADPFAFKRTNLIIHLLNGALLYALLLQLGRVFEPAGRRAALAAALGAALWLLHPLLVSTTLYVVQREAMLPATCVMLGLLAWLHGRHLLATGRRRSGLAWTVLGLGGGITLGVLAKANGALLPFYALLIEWIVLAPRQPLLEAATRRVWRGVMAVFAVLPATLLLAYLAYVGIHTAIHGIAVRPWTEGQRLLSEARVLMDYLGLLWLPRPFTPGLFNDQIRASLSLFSPATTLPALLAVLGLIGAGFALRRRAPLIALAILFYFAGQLLESTTIPLELYFEHRNYVPALLLFWPLAWWLADLRALRLPKLLLMLALPLGLALMTHARAEVWGNGRMQAELWARLNPDSPRAQANAAQFELAHGQPRDAIARLRPLLRQHPDQVQLAFNLLGARCALGGVNAADLAAARTAMATTRDPGALLTHWFDRTLPVAAAGGCSGLDLAALRGLIQAGLDNPRLDVPGRQQDLLYLRGRIALVERRPAAALTDFERALDVVVSPGFALEGAAILGSAGHPRAGLALLDHYDRVAGRATRPGFGMPMLHAWVLRLQNYWPHEEVHLRKALVEAAAQETPGVQRTPPVAALRRPDPSLRSG